MAVKAGECSCEGRDEAEGVAAGTVRWRAPLAALSCCSDSLDEEVCRGGGEVGVEAEQRHRDGGDGGADSGDARRSHSERTPRYESSARTKAIDGSQRDECTNGRCGERRR